MGGGGPVLYLGPLLAWEWPPLPVGPTVNLAGGHGIEREGAVPPPTCLLGRRLVWGGLISILRLPLISMPEFVRTDTELHA